MKKEYLTIEYEPEEQPTLQIVDDNDEVIFETKVVEEKIPMNFDNKKTGRE